MVEKIKWHIFRKIVFGMIIAIIIYLIIMSLPIYDCGYQVIDRSCTGWDNIR